MALLNCNFFSYELGMNTQMQVLLPEVRHEKRSLEQKKHRVLYCLHGHAQDHTSWGRLGNLELLLGNTDIIAVMPNALRSFYSNGEYGHRYFSFLTKELPVIIHNYFNGSIERQDNFIFGYSMGGYGALKAALSFPSKYAGAAVYSVAAEPFETLKWMGDKKLATVPDLERNLYNIFGSEEDFHRSDDNLKNLLEKLPLNREQLPRIYHACGTGDFTYSSNLALREALLKSGLATDYTYEEWNGEHDWYFWAIALEKSLRHFQIL